MFDSLEYDVRHKTNEAGRVFEVLEDGETILESREPFPDLREGLALYSSDGDLELEIVDEQVLDVPTSFTLLDGDENVIGGFKRHWSFFTHSWRLVSSKNLELGVARDKHRPVSLARRFLSRLFPLKYRIFSRTGEEVGSIETGFSPKDRYRIKIREEAEQEIDPEHLIGLALVIDIEESS